MKLSTSSIDSLWLLLEDLQNGGMTTSKAQMSGYVTALDQVLKLATIEEIQKVKH